MDLEYARVSVCLYSLRLLGHHRVAAMQLLNPQVMFMNQTMVSSWMASSFHNLCRVMDVARVATWLPINFCNHRRLMNHTMIAAWVHAAQITYTSQPQEVHLTH